MAWNEKDYHDDFALAGKAGAPPGKSFARALYNLERIATALEACAQMLYEDREARKQSGVRVWKHTGDEPPPAPHRYEPLNGANDACKVCGYGADTQWHHDAYHMATKADQVRAQNKALDEARRTGEEVFDGYGTFWSIGKDGVPIARAGVKDS